MEKLSDIVYTELFDDNSAVLGWDKETVRYAQSHKRDIIMTISNVANNIGYKIKSDEKEIVYSDVLVTMYSKNDYDISKAISKDLEIVPFDGYIFSIVKYCTLKYIDGISKSRKHCSTDIVKNQDGEESSIFDNIKDETAATYEFNVTLQEACKVCEHKRYMCGFDIFLMLFVRIATMAYSKEGEFDNIMDILGVSRSDIDMASKIIKKDDSLRDMTQAIVASGVDALDAIRAYTYAANDIEEVVRLA